MYFARTEEQQYFAETVAGISARASTPGHVRAAWTAEHTGATDLWKSLDSAGFLTLLAPEALGGGGSELEAAVALEELGRAAAPGPLVEHALVSVPLLAALAPERLAKAIESGEVFTASETDLVPHSRAATTALLLRGERVLAVDVADATAVESLDGARQLVRVDAGRIRDSEAVSDGTEAAIQVERARDRGALGTAAMLIGLSARAVEMTVEYVSIRQQFGVPVGSFQAVKHHLANAHVGIDFARPVVDAAAWALALGDAAAPRLCSMAKVSAGEAARRAAKVSLQCHGAIGYTMEADLHLYLMRIWSLLNAWGTVDHHRDRVAAEVLDGGTA